MRTRPNATTTPATPAKTSPSCRDAPQPARPHPVGPCEIGPLIRSNYYTGKLLTERELTAEQTYHIDRRRLHDVALHGWGAVCGLKVVPATDERCRGRYVLVEPGVAVDGAGREIQVRAAVQVALPQPPPKPPTDDPCPHEYGSAPPPPPPVQSPPPPPPQAQVPPPPAVQSPPAQTTPSRAQKPDASVAASPPASPPPASTAPPAGAAKEEEPCDPPPCPDTEDLYVRIRYVECETEFTPAPFDDCNCGTGGQQPNRIVEGFEVDLLRDKPADWDKIADAFRDCVDDCDDLYGQSLHCCPGSCWPTYIPLAVIRDFQPGGAVTAPMIDNRCSRPILPSTRRLDQLVHCILDKIPARTTTQIRDFNWSHGQIYDCHDFYRWFIEDHHGLRHFEVAFTGPVIASCLSPIVFQATVVRHERGRERFGYVETVPAVVWPESDGMKFFLRIDKSFAEHCLRGASFDLYLTLHCDVVLDHWGVPVDGDLLARLEGPTPVVKPPTGDGIAGGTFRSWLRVHA